MKFIFTAFLIIFCSFNLFGQSNATKEEYTVYTAVMKSIYAEGLKHEGHKTSFVILNKTIEPDFSKLTQVASYRI